MKPISKIILLASFLAVTSCDSSKKLIKQINYLTVAVPEEGSLKLTQYTNESENILHPQIISDPITKMLMWYAPPLLSVSPDGGKIAYIAAANKFKNLNLKNIKGGQSVIQRTFNRNVVDMNFSPDGKNIVFTEEGEGNSDIYMINATEGVAIQQLVSTSANELSPSFSPDGQSVFFAKSIGTNYHIWSLNRETSLLTQFTQGYTPSLAPNGVDLIISRNNKDTSFGEIWMVNINKGVETLLLSDPEKSYSSPNISPDGKYIICVGTTKGSKTKPMNLDLYLVKLDGTKLTQLSFHGGHDVSPVWNTDGNSVFFISQRGNAEGDYNVWKMDLTNILKTL